MSIGKLVEEIILKSVFDGCELTITGLETEKRDSWYSEFRYPSKKMIPHDIVIKHEGTPVATTLLSSTSATDSGVGVSATLKFRLEYSSDSGRVHKTGFIKSSATPWPSFPNLGRPDYALLLFGLDGEAPQEVSRSVPMLINPDPFYIAFGKKGDQVLMVASTEDSLGTKVVSSILDGIITAHTKALSWCFGAI